MSLELEYIFSVSFGASENDVVPEEGKQTSGITVHHTFNKIIKHAPAVLTPAM